MPAQTAVVLIDGEPATGGDLAELLLGGYAHYSTMQVRSGAVRGLDLHRARLAAQHRELFGTELDLDRVQQLMRDAIEAQPDAYLRVSVDEPEPGRARVMTVVRPPEEPADRPVSLLPVPYVRPFAHLKHVGTFGQHAYARMAAAKGFDDAALMTSDGRLCETSISNVGFVRGETVVWPDGPALLGITRQLLDRELADDGVQVLVEPVTLDVLDDFDAAFTTNSIGIAAVSRIGDHEFPPPPASDPVSRLAALLAAVPPTPI
jgi:branched-subunit amino acid aminotransferase/4-amino-4-deoxychorismate lyase